MIKYDIGNSLISFLMFKQSKYYPNEEIFYLYQTTPHTLKWGGLGHIFESSIKLNLSN
jgi:hypothetical protein